MFSAVSAAIMATQVHMTQVKNSFSKRSDHIQAEYIYKNKIDKIDATEKYQKSRLPESGYMTVAEYEAKSKPKTKKEINAKILKEPEFPKDSNMVYVPQYKFKLVKYNDPIGSPEISLPRKLNFDRQINGQGIVSGDYEKMVYPSVYYYAESDCTSCDLFLINLDASLNHLDRVEKANIVNKETEPLISTDKSIETKFIFRTLTPIDFSNDNSKLAVKEKIGHRHDGIWKTELWVYDFNKKEAKSLPQLRDAIVYYWQNQEKINLDEHRWDIYPLGFDANNDNRIVVCAYAFTGNIPKFLGTWSIDADGTETKLESITETSIPVSAVGYRLEKDEQVKPISEVEFEAKKAKKDEKHKEKQLKTEKRFENSQNKIEYKRKIRQMDMETMLKIKQRQDEQKELRKKYIEKDASAS